MLERIRIRADGSGFWACVIVLWVLSIVILAMMGAPPKDAKPVVEAVAKPTGLTDIEDHEFTNGILHVLRDNQTEQVVLLYEGRDTVMTVMGGGSDER